MINNMVFSKRLKITLVVTFLLLTALIFTVNSSNNVNVINPESNDLDENPRAGLDYALVYNAGELYAAILEDDENLGRIQNDLAVFARANIPELKNPDSLIGFTFDSGSTKENNIYVLYGYFYGSDDRIKLTVSVYETGVISLSIINIKDGSSVDSSLNLNGLKNQLIVRLPIESDYYSIRFYKTNDKIIASFYRGYSVTDVDAVVKILNDAYEGAFVAGDVVFNINAVGNFSLDEVRAYSTNPENNL